MKIGIDASRIAKIEKSGTENYTYNLIKALARIDKKNYYTLYFNQPPEFFELNEENFSSKIIPARRFWTQLRLASEIALHPPDILFVPAHTIPILRKPGVKTVVTVHDLGAEFLAAYHKFPDRLYLTWSTAFVANYASRIIAVSSSTKSDLERQYKVSSERVSVVPEGVDLSFFKKATTDEVVQVKKKYGLKRPFFLFVGTIQPRKNLAKLIEALAKSEVGFDLVVAGKAGWLYEDIFASPSKFGIEEKVKFLGYVETADLPALYSSASAFVFPSLYEGFGLPVLEALACECPVVTSSVSSLPEIAGEAALLVDPNSLEEIKKGLQRISKDEKLRLSLVVKGLKRAQKFTWDRTAQGTLQVLEAVGGQ